MVDVLVTGALKRLSLGWILTRKGDGTEPELALDTEEILEAAWLRCLDFNLDLAADGGKFAGRPECSSAWSGQIEPLERRRELTDRLAVDRDRERDLAVVLK